MIGSISFNPEMLEVARNFRGYSQTRAAELCNMSQPKFSKIENGLSEPNEADLETFSDKMGFPVAFFRASARAIGIPMSFHEMYRKPKSVNVKSQTRVSADLSIRMLCLSRLLRSIELEPELPLPHYDAEDYDNDGPRIAKMLRKTWAVPNGPIRNLTELVERAGIIVFPCFFPAPRVDGVTVAIKGMPPVIFLNESSSADRLRFSLAHELGHVIMHRQISNTMEDEANKFAAEFLLPEQELRNELSGGLDLRQLATLKRIWKVSMASLLVRAKSLGKISDRQSRYLWSQMSQFGYRKAEPPSTQFEREKPSTLKSIFDMYSKQLNYSNADFAETFYLYEEMVRKLFDGQLREERRLKLVV